MNLHYEQKSSPKTHHLHVQMADSIVIYSVPPIPIIGKLPALVLVESRNGIFAQMLYLQNQIRVSSANADCSIEMESNEFILLFSWKLLA